MTMAKALICQPQHDDYASPWMSDHICELFYMDPATGPSAQISFDDVLVGLNADSEYSAPPHLRALTSSALSEIVRHGFPTPHVYLAEEGDVGVTWLVGEWRVGTLFHPEGIDIFAVRTTEGERETMEQGIAGFTNAASDVAEFLARLDRGD